VVANSAPGVPVAIIMAFVSVMLIPVCYYLCIPLWITKSWRERFQFWMGCACYIFCGPFINIAVLLYAVWNMDSFGWGKTRKVISTDESSEGSESDNTLGHDKHGAGPEEADCVRLQPEDLDRMEEIAREEKKIGH